MKHVSTLLRKFLVFPLLGSYGILAQVPVITEPQPYRFEHYPDAVLNSAATAAFKAPGVPSINPVPSYTPANSGNASMTVTERYNIMPMGASPETQRRYADEDIRRHEAAQQQQKELLAQAYAMLDEAHIRYELPFHDQPEKRNYAVAFETIHKMLRGEMPLNLERAVFVAEHTFDAAIRFDEFDRQLNKAAMIIGLQMEQDKLAASDNLAKVMTAFRYMADTLSVASKVEGRITTYPKNYDFSDFWGRTDYRKMFVSKLMREGSGQCHSLPLLFLLLCEKIGADAHLAFAPNHSFIKFQDRRGKWHNLELTNGMLASDHFMAESGYIKAEAMQSGIYLNPLSKKQVIVQCLNDLAMGYQRKYGYDPFVKECATTALQYDPQNLTAHQVLANYYNTLSGYVIDQYHDRKLTKAAFDRDAKAQDIVKAMEQANRVIEDLGYADMPEEAYQAWLSSIQKEVTRQQHTNELKVLGGMIELKK